MKQSVSKLLSLNLFFCQWWHRSWHQACSQTSKSDMLPPTIFMFCYWGNRATSLWLLKQIVQALLFPKPCSHSSAWLHFLDPSLDLLCVYSVYSKSEQPALWHQGHNTTQARQIYDFQRLPARTSGSETCDAEIWYVIKGKYSVKQILMSFCGRRKATSHLEQHTLQKLLKRTSGSSSKINSKKDWIIEAA